MTKKKEEKGITLIATLTNRTFIGINTESSDIDSRRLIGYMIIDDKIPDMDKYTAYYIPYNNIDYAQCDNRKNTRLLCEYSITDKEWDKFIKRTKDEK